MPEIIIDVFGIRVNLLAQIFGFIMLVFVVIAYFCKNEKYFTLTIISSVFCFLESLVLGVWSSAICILLVIIRNFFIIGYMKKGKAYPKVLISLFVFLILAIGIGSAALFEKTWYSFLPPVLTVIDTLYSFGKSVKVLKIGLTFVSFFYIIFNFCAGAYVGVVRQFIAFAVSIGGLIKYLVEERKQKNNKKAELITAEESENESCV